MGQTYTKEKDGNGLRYVDMCIYIDNTMKTWDPDHPLTEEQEENIYKYLYLLYYSLSCKKHYFNSVAEYDSYSLYCATKAYVRMIDPRQFNIIDGKPEMARIKSILNYIKTTLFGWKVYWQKENFATIISADYNKTFDPIAFESEMQNNINSKNKQQIIENIFDDIKLVPYQLKHLIKETPYSDDPIMCKRLYISTMLTFISSIDEYLQIKHIEKHYHKVDSTVLWRLEPDMKPTVVLLFNKLKEQLKDNINDSYTMYNITLDELSNSLWDLIDTTGTFDE